MILDKYILAELPQVTNEENENIGHVLEIEEIYSVVQSLDAKSVAGLDGFGAGFYQSCWEIIKINLLLVVQECFKGVQQPRGITSI